MPKMLPIIYSFTMRPYEQYGAKTETGVYAYNTSVHVTLCYNNTECYIHFALVIETVKKLITLDMVQ